MEFQKSGTTENYIPLRGTSTPGAQAKVTAEGNFLAMLNIDAGINRAIREVSEEQPWDGYYAVRGSEIKNLLRFIELNNLGKVLDIGCGNGFISYLISSISKEVIATDLYSKDARTHTVGLDSAKRLISKIGSKNIFLLASSMEYMPFKDETFDTIFSLYTLHYLKDRTLALNELKRVLKKNGIIILVIPNFIERIYAFFQFYLYLFIKSFRVAREKIFKKGKLIFSNSNKKTASFSLAKLKENYKYFPFPGPHGAYKNSAVEMIRHMPIQWNKEFRKAGFEISRSLTTAFLPYPLLLTISLKITHIISALFEHFTQACGDKPFLKYLGYNYCVILKK